MITPLVWRIRPRQTQSTSRTSSDLGLTSFECSLVRRSRFRAAITSLEIIEISHYDSVQQAACGEVLSSWKTTHVKVRAEHSNCYDPIELTRNPKHDTPRVQSSFTSYRARACPRIVRDSTLKTLLCNRFVESNDTHSLQVWKRGLFLKLSHSSYSWFSTPGPFSEWRVNSLWWIVLFLFQNTVKMHDFNPIYLSL